MKRNFLILAVVFIVSSCASNTSFNSFYKENKNASEFSISSPAFLVKMFIDKDDLEEFRPLFKKVKHSISNIYNKDLTRLE